MNWLPLTQESQLEEIDQQSRTGSSKGIVIFKHSTRCSISVMAKDRLERNCDPTIPVYYLDLLSYRGVSNAVEDRYQIQHESPQVLVIKDGSCEYHASHNRISLDQLKENL